MIFKMTLIEWFVFLIIVVVAVSLVFVGYSQSSGSNCREQKLSDGSVCLVCKSYDPYRPDTVSCGSHP
jgi:hypothetical protein